MVIRSRRGRPLSSPEDLYRTYRLDNLDADRSGKSSRRYHSNYYEEGSREKGIGDFLRVRMIMSVLDLGIKNVRDATKLSHDFLSRADGRLRERHKASLLELARNCAAEKQCSLNLSDEYFTQPFRSVAQLRQFLMNEDSRPAGQGDMSIDVEGLPAEPRLTKDNPSRTLMDCLLNFLDEDAGDIFLIYGDQGYGKTMLFSAFVHTYVVASRFGVIYIDCARYRNYPQVVSRIYGYLRRNAEAVGSSTPTTDVKEMVYYIMSELEQRPVLIILNNFESAASLHRNTYHTIRDDSLAELIRHATLGNRSAKVILGSSCKLDDFAEVGGSHRKTMPPSAPDSWGELIDGYSGMQIDKVRKSYHQLIEATTAQSTTGLIMAVAAVLVILDPEFRTFETKTDLEKKTDFEAKTIVRLINRRDLKSLVATAISLLDDHLRLALRLIALSEDGMRQDTLETCLRRQGRLSPDKSSECIKLLVTQLFPLIRRVKPEVSASPPRSPESGDVDEPQEYAYDLHAEIRRLILMDWERTSQGVLQKRRAHRQIARIALESLGTDQQVEEEATFQSLFQFRRKFQAFTHLLGAVTPGEIFLEDKRAVSSDFRSLKAKVIEDVATPKEFVLCALHLWTEEIDPKDGYRLSRHFGADVVKLEMLSALFHIGFSYPSASSPLSREPAQLPMCVNTISGTAEQIPKEFRPFEMEVYSGIAIASLRAHNFSLCSSAVEKGAHVARKYQNGDYQARFAKILGDLLIREGQLAEAEWVVAQEIDRYQQNYVLEYSQKVRRKAKSKERNKLKFAVKHYMALLGRLAEIHYLQGRFTAAAGDFNEALDAPGKFLVNDKKNFRRTFLKGGASRSFLRFAIRLSRYAEHPNLFQDVLTEVEGKDFNWYRREAHSILAKNRHRIEYKKHLENELAAVELDNCIWSRSEVPEANPGPSHVETVAKHFEAAKRRAWAGFVSPLVKMELLREEILCHWIRYSLKKQYSLEQLEEYRNRALMLTDRLVDLTRYRGYPLLECDALLLRAEILKQSKQDQARAAVDLGRAHDIMVARDYALRWPDWQLINDSYVLPSRVLVC